ncbi:MAG: bifunctional 2-C-methyl-D-erythritol 4-phosphate cytidylyltransferase/2-C-methyl-D-erythritol 2,4-cyclodiphosphate synthase [Sphingomonas bacterium]
MTRTGTVALIVAAGQGVRSGGTLPKQFATLAGKPMIAHSFAALAEHPGIERVVVAIGQGQETALSAALGHVEHITGGATRRLSVLAGLEALTSGNPERVLIHDAARPFLSSAVIDRLLTALDSSEGAVPALPVADTIARNDSVLGDSRLGEVVSRDGLHRVQTPQAFRFHTVLATHRNWVGDEPTDDAQMVRKAGGGVALVEGDMMLEKITYPADFAAAEARHAGGMRVRSATGFDVHRLVEGEQLWLGGVLIPHNKGLSGHSDADVALHAITDALLGTIAEGDIGTHFPPTDPQWRGADSAQFLEHAASLVTARGGIIDFIDLTLICEAPKIGPHRTAMRDRIAALLRLAPGQISVKATTTERLGFAGRGEGIAAQAIATIRIPGEM